MDRVGIGYFRALPVRPCSEHAQACIRLFRAVVDQMTEDLLSIPRSSEEEQAKGQAAVWFRRTIPFGYNTAPMDEVCDLAGLDPDFVLERVTKLHANISSKR